MNALEFMSLPKPYVPFGTYLYWQRAYDSRTSPLQATSVTALNEAQRLQLRQQFPVVTRFFYVPPTMRPVYYTGDWHSRHGTCVVPYPWLIFGFRCQFNYANYSKRHAGWHSLYVYAANTKPKADWSNVGVLPWSHADYNDDSVRTAHGEHVSYGACCVGAHNGTASGCLMSFYERSHNFNMYALSKSMQSFLGFIDIATFSRNTEISPHQFFTALSKFDTHQLCKHDFHQVNMNNFPGVFGQRVTIAQVERLLELRRTVIEGERSNLNESLRRIAK